MARVLTPRQAGSDERDVGCGIAWWLLGLTVFVAPLFLGGNQAWIWSLLAALGFLTFAVFLLFSRLPLVPSDARQRTVFFLILLLAAYPLLQILPLPRGVMEIIAPGSVHASPDDPGGFVTASIDVMRTLEIGMRQAGALLLALVALRLFRSRRVGWQFVDLLVVAGLLNAFWGVTQFFSGDAVTGSYANKNHFVSLMAMAMPLSVAATIRRWRRCRARGYAWVSDPQFMLRAAASFVLLLALALSGSRGGLAASVLALVLVVLLFAAASGRWVSMAAKTIALLVGVSVVLVLAVGLDGASNAYKWGFNNERIVQWSDTLEAVPDFWLLGSGVGTYDFVYPAHKSPELSYPRFNHAHNDYLEFLLTTGGGGLLMFAAVFGMVLAGAVVQKRLREGVATNALRFGAMWSVIAALFHAVVDFNMQIPSNFLILMLVLSLLANCSRSAFVLGSKDAVVPAD